MGKIKLIAFDLDGVLVNGDGSWWVVHKALGTYEASKKHARQYYENKITFDEWARKDAALWHGIEMEKIREALYGAELMPGIREAISQLKERYTLAIISGGLQTLADRVKEEFGMDYAVANKLKVEGGRVCGVEQTVDFQGKGRVLESLADECGLKTHECAAVGDYTNDIPMFKVAGFSIAFNPKDEEIIKYANEVIYEKNLKNILPYFN